MWIIINRRNKQSMKIHLLDVTYWIFMAENLDLSNTIFMINKLNKNNQIWEI